MTRILKASAGAGKTYNLTKTYLTLVLKDDDPYVYRHILAVTFTNKVTEEMKSKILRHLYILANNPSKSIYIKDFVPDLFETDDLLKQRAATVLSNILHDYSAFAVSTIDKFFQHTLKAFSHEVGRFASYKVELDRDGLIEESVDAVLDALTKDDKDIITWLKDSVLDRLGEGKKTDIEKALKGAAVSLMSGEHLAVVDAAGVDDGVYEMENIKKVKSSLIKYRKQYSSQLKQAANAVFQAFDSVGLSTDMTSYHFMSGLKAYLEMKESEIGQPGSRFVSNAPDYSLWFKKSDLPKYVGYENVLMPPVMNFYNLIMGDSYMLYNTANLILKQLDELSMASRVKARFMDLLKEKNVLSIDDSYTILRDIIDGSDAPFIYEKIGTRYDNYLLDEFQDTSRIQWDNFKPLIGESVSRNGEVLLVGDVKQSIYRWRGSDWGLMANDAPNFLGVTPTNLTGNYRSLKEIVDFNNKFFPWLAGNLENLAQSETGEGGIAQIYGADMVQSVNMKDPQQGYVEGIFCDKELQPMLVKKTIQDLTEKHSAFYGDIAILVRGNKEGRELAAYLISQGIPVVSEEALSIRNSSIVRIVVSLLTVIANPNDAIGSWLAKSYKVEIDKTQFNSLMDLCESLLRTMRDKKEKVFEKETAYIQAFMDVVKKYCESEGNEVMGFVKYIKENDFAISSPDDANAVRIMTIHKSKGLEFPHVIFPYVEKVDLYKWGSHWSCPNFENTPFADLPKMAYNVNFSNSAANSLFKEDFFKEKRMQYIDNINTLYVALTRAQVGMTLIGTNSDKAMSGFLLGYMADEDNGFTHVIREIESTENGPIEIDSYQKGEIYDFNKLPREEKEAKPLKCDFPSWPLNEEKKEEDNAEMKPVGERGRLKFSADSLDFFSKDGEVGMEASPRLKGIILHKILSSVKSASELDEAVEDEYINGNLNAEEKESTLDLLKKAMTFVADRGWFPEDGRGVMNEISLISAAGEFFRPDRVVETKDGLFVIDYKFGKDSPKYKKQVETYVNLYKELGYSNVRGYLWFVPENRIEDVC